MSSAQTREAVAAVKLDTDGLEASPEARALVHARLAKLHYSATHLQCALQGTFQRHEQQIRRTDRYGRRAQQTRNMNEEALMNFIDNTVLQGLHTVKVWAGQVAGPILLS